MLVLVDKGDGEEFNKAFTNCTQNFSEKLS